MGANFALGRATLRNVCAYRTVLLVAAIIVAGLPPIELLASKKQAAWQKGHACLGTPTRTTYPTHQHHTSEPTPLRDGRTSQSTAEAHAHQPGHAGRWERSRRDDVPSHSVPDEPRLFQPIT